MSQHIYDPSAPSYNRDHLHAIIKRFREAFPVNFDKCGLEECSHCDGSGVPNHKRGNELTYWVPGNYCSHCSGFGVIGITRIYDEYLCKSCRGEGCDKCKHRGTVDWISRVVKG